MELMKTNRTIKLFLVDDDAVFLKMLEIEFLQYSNLEVKTFATGELCLNNLSMNPDVVVLDYHLDGVEKNAINGIETLDRIKSINTDLPVIMLSSQDKIEVAIECMHHRAQDYVVKSETSFMRLKNIITGILDVKKLESELTWYMDRM
jgi:two-component system, OmpR family, response regulator